MGISEETENNESDPDIGDLHNVSIEAMREGTLCMLSTLLNPRKLILTDKGLPRDYHGLAQLVGIEGHKLPYIAHNNDYTKHILKLWQQQDKEKATLEKLFSYLEEMDRYDVVDEIKLLIADDIKVFNNCKRQVARPDINLGADNLVLTRDDLKRLEKGLELQQYDAFVLYAEDDIDFATQMIDTLENQYNLKLCAKDRDLVVGVFEHESVIQLITERCNRLIAIITSAFFESKSNKFFCNFAQSLGIEQRQRKIIPCLYQPCDNIPSNLKCYFMLDYQRAGKLWDFYEKLRDSIKVPKSPLNSMHRAASQKIEPSSETKIVAKTLQPKKENVKFNSMVNLNFLPDDTETVAVVPNITPSSSSNSIDIHTKNKRHKTISWIKNWLTHKERQDEKCHKKSIWPKRFKQKIAVAQ